MLLSDLGIDQISSMNTTIKRSKYGLKAQLIRSIKATRAFVNPIVITRNSNWPYWILKVVLGISCSLIFN